MSDSRTYSFCVRGAILVSNHRCEVRCSRKIRHPRSKFLAEAAGVKVVMTAPESNQEVLIITQASRTSIVLKIDNPQNNTNNKKLVGFHLSRSKWDPYPWVGYVETGSIADSAGLRAGDCLLDIDGTDLVGLGVKEIASLIQRESGDSVRLEVWRSFHEEHPDAEDGVALAGPLPEVAKKLAKAISGTVRALECPVCLESASSPVSQCVHGHILCVGCRAKTPRCPVCRVRLGQGRCLLADQVQRNIREAFNDEASRDDSSPNNNSSLREKLFGSRNKKLPDRQGNDNNSSRISSARVKSSIARLLLGGFDKAASAENLSEARLIDENSGRSIDGRPAAYRRLGELCQNDRTKSASTGELSKGNDSPMNSSIHCHSANRVYTSVSGLLSVPQTPTWGGSTESINNSSFLCPLSRSISCKELVSANFVLQHLATCHEGAQVTFNGRIAKIPLPLPFGPESTYILRHAGELFFFQYGNEEAWVATASTTENIGQWSMLGKNNDGTEVKLRRLVAKLEDNSAPLACHLAPLPKALGINFVVVELLDARLGEGLEV